jgi:hypothetical protein
MPRRDFEEVASADVRLDAGVDHANDQLARDAVARVSHRARVGRTEQRLLIGFPGPTGLEDRVHPGAAVGHFDDGDATALLHVEALVGRFEPSCFYRVVLHRSLLLCLLLTDEADFAR